MPASSPTASKKTVVIGASPNPERYAYLATQRLRRAGHEVVAVGLRPGRVADVELRTDRPALTDVDTVTLYVGPHNQPAWRDYILSLRPRRIIFNPGTENASLDRDARALGIETEEACTLVMLASGTY